MSTEELINILLQKRGLTTPAQITEFFHPTPPEKIPLESSGLSSQSVSAAIQLIKLHLEKKDAIAVYGDYDVDGMCSTAILWETLYDKKLSPQVFPYIPHRRTEGYGLSIAGMDACLAKGAKLIITVDNGIVAHKQIAYARDRGCDVIIIDHHEPEGELPIANVLVHSTATCAAALTWFFTREYLSNSPRLTKERGRGEVWKGEVPTKDMLNSREGGDPCSGKGEVLDQRPKTSDHLSLVSLALVCDLIPLLGLNRSLVKHGLEAMKTTSRPGLLALFKEAAIDPATLEAYHLGFIIGPRLNAMGRLEHAVDSLRLLCTKDPTQAQELASLLGETNRSRQQLTIDSTTHAISFIETHYPKLQKLPKLLMVADPSYDEGVIGLIAAKLVEKFHRPAIAIAVGEEFSKASARSVSGFHITDHLRTAAHLLSGVGGHAMAAGFTVPNASLDELQNLLISSADTSISSDLLVHQHRVDAELPLSLINIDLWSRLQDFAPFGLGNPKPVFSTSKVAISSPRWIGKSANHLKFKVDNLDAIYFQAPKDLPIPLTVSTLVYSLSLNIFNGVTSIQLLIKSTN